MNDDKKLSIVSVIDNILKKDIEVIKKSWEKYFLLEHKFARPDELQKLSSVENKVDIIFIDQKHLSSFKLKYYKSFQGSNQNFMLIVFKNQRNLNDIKIYKNLVDQIVYLDDMKIVEWNTIAILRRYWNTYSKPTTIIYKSIIADFVENVVSIEGEVIPLTSKENDMLRLLLNSRGQYIKKEEMFQKIWDVQEKDHSRVVDQILFKLKRKIGEEYFHISRAKGVKFE